MKKILALVLVMVLSIGFLAACGEKEDDSGSASIVGTWEYENGGYTYEFKEDGTGTYDVGTVMEFTYTAEDGVLSILYTNNTSPTVLDYTITGKKLNIKDSFGSDTIYNKK